MINNQVYHTRSINTLESYPSKIARENSCLCVLLPKRHAEIYFLPEDDTPKRLHIPYRYVWQLPRSLHCTVQIMLYNLFAETLLIV